MTDNRRYWMWIPTLDFNVKLRGDRCLVEPKKLHEDTELQTIVDSINPNIGRASFSIGYLFWANEQGYIIHTFQKTNVQISANSTYILVNAFSNESEPTILNITLENGGLLELEAGIETPISLIDDIFRFIVQLYHVHAHSDRKLTFQPFEADDRTTALRTVCDQYACHIVREVKVYRTNAKKSDMYFKINSHMIYAQSFLDKYGQLLGEDGKRLQYIITTMGKSVELTFKREELNISHSTVYNTTLLNDRLLLYTILSICVAFFAGSIVNDALSDTDKVWITLGALIAFIVAGIVFFLLANYLTKRKTKN